MGCILMCELESLLLHNVMAQPACRRAATWDPMQHAVERLQAAAAGRRGSAEEITALFIALLRSHGLAVRFVRCDAAVMSISFQWPFGTEWAALAR